MYICKTTMEEFAEDTILT